MPKKVLIVDCGLKHLSGHNFTYTRAVQSALEQRGAKVTVLANKHMIGDLARIPEYHPVFSVSIFDQPPGNGKVRDLIYLYAQSIIFSDELEQAFKQHKVDEQTLVLCHTIRDFVLIGWNRYLARNKFPGCLTIVERLTPNFESCSRWKTLVHPYWRIKPHYLNAIRTRLGERFVFLTDSELLSADYAHIYRHPIVTLPIPVHDLFLSADSAETVTNGLQGPHGLPPRRSIKIGYVGGDRTGKGFWMLPELIKRVLSDATIQTQFIIQCPNLAATIDKGQPSNGDIELWQIAQSAGDKVRLIYDNLSESEYARLLRQLDVVLLPYADPSYVKGTSGIFAEAAALSKPVVVSSGTWMAAELKKSGGGVEFRNGDIDDLAAKVMELVRNYEEYVSKAEQFSVEWKSFHNPRTLVEILLKACNQGSGIPSNGIGHN